MSKSRNLLSVSIGDYRQITLRYYRGDTWWTPTFPFRKFFFRFFNVRELDGDGSWRRFALDFGKLSLLFENYDNGKVSS